MTIYDTLDHQIAGFAQQQSFGGSLSFNSQCGLIDVATLPVISIDGAATPQQPPPQPAPSTIRTESAAPETRAQSAVDILAMLERLAELRNKGVLTDDEYQGKKADLLARL